MAQKNENPDNSNLLKLDVLIHFDIVSHSFYELGLKKLLALSSDKQLTFLYINPQGNKCVKNYFWDFVDNPIYCLCFEPSGTWVVIVSEQRVLLVPFLPLFVPQDTFDYKWSLSSVTVLPLATIPKPTSVVFWLTKDSESILIIGSKNGCITFYCLETQKTIGECKVPGEIVDLQMCFDDALDLLVLLITGNKSQHWKLVLEHRSVGYNWMQQIRAQPDKDKKDGFMSYIRQLSRDKITLLIQGGSKDDNKSTVEYLLKPSEYLPLFRKISNIWSLTSQYVNGQHFLSAFELNEGSLILENPEEDTPSRTMRPHIKKDGLYVQALWSQRIIYLLKKNGVEVHSASFSVVQPMQKESSELWSAEVIGDVRKGYLMSAKEPAAPAPGWREPTFLCDLQLQRFALQPCLVITSLGAYVISTAHEPSEWMVGMITRGGGGGEAERWAAALGAPVPALLRAAADMLLARGKPVPAQYLYSLSQSLPDGWAARLGVFGRLNELATFKPVSNAVGLGNAAVTIKTMASLLRMGTNSEEKFDLEMKFTSLTPVELLELCSIAAAIGLWELVPMFSVHRGHPTVLLSALNAKSNVCRGALNCVLQQNCVVPLLLKENAEWFFDLLIEKCSQFDTMLLKRLCLWLNPLQDQLRPVMRDLKQKIMSSSTEVMCKLITTFAHIASEIESRKPCLEIHDKVPEATDTWKNQYVPRRALSCGLAHWAVVDEGNAKVMMTSTPIHTDLIGRVIDVACGRHHTLVLTENGLYASGDNSYGQLGVGASWAGGVGDAAATAGALLPVAGPHSAPLKAVAAGHYHSAAVDVGGRLYTWGWGVHGQLGLGTIDDHCTPQLVKKLQGRKVVTVTCGACHTVALLGGEVWVMGAGAFGQLGRGRRDKASVPKRLPLNDPAVDIAAGYFHNLVLTTKGQLYCWGASPQQVRAANARRMHSPTGTEAGAATHTPPGPDPHLAPQLVDTSNVRGRIAQIAAGWHHSCLLDSNGSIYTWGLNLDGQLGTGDRKQLVIPTEVSVRNEAGAKHVSEGANALVACGGDFTVFLDGDGRLYAAGDLHQPRVEKEKTSNRVIMMKTTKRVIKIPAAKANNKFLFHPIDRVDIMFPFDIHGTRRKNIEHGYNPLQSLDDFDKTTWPDDVILLLKPWINAPDFNANPNMASKLAYHNQRYTDCFKLQLENIVAVIKDEKLFLAHTEVPNQDQSDKVVANKVDERKITITDTMSKRIKDISLTILNKDAYPVVDESTYRSLPCCCNELNYLTGYTAPKTVVNITEQDLSVRAANVIDKCISMFPIEAELWGTCFRYAKDYFMANNLAIGELEAVLRKYMETDATTMAAAVMYSDNSAEYGDILSSKFYLNMCSQVVDRWG